MKTRRDALILMAGSVPAATLISPAARAGTVAGFGGSTEITQILNNVQLLGTVGNTALTAGRMAVRAVFPTVPKS